VTQEGKRERSKYSVPFHSNATATMADTQKRNTRCVMSTARIFLDSTRSIPTTSTRSTTTTSFHGLYLVVLQVTNCHYRIDKEDRGFPSSFLPCIQSLCHHLIRLTHKTSAALAGGGQQCILLSVVVVRLWKDMRNTITIDFLCL
jgi:hypothetical protein